MTTDPLPQDNRPVIYSRPPSHDWGSALIAACFALGFAMAWGTYEMRQRVGQEQNVAGYRHTMDALVSEQSDLGRLLANPRTKVVRLTPSPEESSVRFATVAWNDDSQSGAIFCDTLTNDGRRRYSIWLVPASGDATAVAFGPTEPGRDVYPFSPTRPAAPPSEFILTDWSEARQPADAGRVLARGTVQ